MMLNKSLLNNFPWLLGILTICFNFSCATLDKAPPPRMTGTFEGITYDGDSVKVSFKQDANTVIGSGSVGDKEFALSGLASWHSSAVVVFEEGTRTNIDLILSQNGEEITIRGFERPLKLARSNDLPHTTSGSFQGIYIAPGPTNMWVNLSQTHELIAGTGYINGSPVSVAGKTTDELSANGSILFSDDSRMGVKITLSEDGRKLIVKGLGEPIEMQRR